MQILTDAKPANFSHYSTDRAALRTHLKTIHGRYERGLVVGYNYRSVEYLNAPDGLIVLAHQATGEGQVDGIHPKALSKYVQHPVNIIEPLEGEADGYALHYLSRRHQGCLVLGAFGRMIDAGALAGC